MMKKKAFKKHNLSIRLTEEEFTLLHEKWKETTFRAFADFIRALIFHTPLVQYSRNRSLDEITPILGGINDQLEGIRRDLARAVKDLRERPEKKEVTETLAVLRSAQFSAGRNIDEIKPVILKIYEHVCQI
jgi:hypothetical protein